ncbi:PA26 p53-induced protein-domain-containing protein [Radiomyces spectabilis]|uniref:PA26 p53-induced protein-domain-containing protein n=1 Tax=Radiomyces spectabilis TaxID=64574 RepID=UPI00221F899B|nr:PA26 p53-induced protein-domain-containing protein [Radiomyces spectabilis]KAI8394052.1 PA26 p53-induced protein-domain-containing protein [Radiomyces spectabilis]
MEADLPHSTLSPTLEEELARDTRARQLQSFRLRIALFKPLQTVSDEEREVALDRIIEVAQSYLHIARAPFSPCRKFLFSPFYFSSEARATFDPACSSPPLSPEDEFSVQALESKLEADNADDQLQHFLLTILRLSKTCPFADVRHTLSHFLQTVSEASTVPVPRPAHHSPSYFISLKDIFSLESTPCDSAIMSYPRPSNFQRSSWSHEISWTVSDTEPREPCLVSPATDTTTCDDGRTTGGRPTDDYIRQMFVRLFLEEGRITNVFRVMAFFPTFYEIYHLTYTEILKSSTGPLPPTWKIYLGIMAAAEHGCQYLVSLLKLEFLQAQGNAKWLKGIHHCPVKLQRISLILLKMARQPWRLRLQDIVTLIGGMPGSPRQDAWSKGELVQAILVMATVLGLSTFVLGCGIAPEVDMRGGYTVAGNSILDVYPCEGIERELDQTLTLMVEEEQEAIRAASSATGWHDSSILLFEDQDENEDLVKKRGADLITKLQSYTSSLSSPKSCPNFTWKHDTPWTGFSDKGHDTDANENEPVRYPAYEDLSRFADPVADKDIQRQDFEQVKEQYDPFMLGVYCWEDHGCDIVNQFLPGVGDDLDDEFTEALSITDWSLFLHMTDAAIDTTPLRHAIWYYTQRLLGVIKEDYNYEDFAAYLNDRSKDYIKRACCFPHQLGAFDWNNMGLPLRAEEKCHMILLIASAKKQALICYALALIEQVL